MENRTSEMMDADRTEFERGYVQVYTGDGKGKTTAAVGLAVRAAGAGLWLVAALIRIWNAAFAMNMGGIRNQSRFAMSLVLRMYPVHRSVYRLLVWRPLTQLCLIIRDYSSYIFR